jgi:hypothetical protein
MKLANSRLLDLVFVMAQRGSSLAQLLRKIADANSVVLLIPLCASSVAKKDDVLGLSGCPYIYRAFGCEDFPSATADHPTI